MKAEVLGVQKVGLLGQWLSEVPSDVKWAVAWVAQWAVELAGARVAATADAWADPSGNLKVGSRAVYWVAE